MSSSSSSRERGVGTGGGGSSSCSQGSGLTTAQEKKRQRELQKQEASEEKKRRREEIKALNAKKKEADKQQKVQEQHLKRQRKGAYSDKEIIIALDPRYYDDLFDSGRLSELSETYTSVKLGGTECPSALCPQVGLATFLNNTHGKASTILWARQASLDQYWPPSLSHMEQYPPKPLPYVVMLFGAEQLMKLSEHEGGATSALISMLDEAKQGWMSAFESTHLQELPGHTAALASVKSRAEGTAAASLRMIVVFEEVKTFLNRSLLQRQEIQSDKRKVRTLPFLVPFLP